MPGFEWELTTKQRFFLYLYELCPNIEIIQSIWKQFINDRDETSLNYYKKISPFRPHPCGPDSIFNFVAGFIDPDMFLIYYEPREMYLTCIQMIGHPYFICKFDTTRNSLETNINYFDALINQAQIKLNPCEKMKVLNQTISNLEYNMDTYGKVYIVRYLYALYNMYKQTKILKAYPLAIDNNGELCRFD